MNDFLILGLIFAVWIILVKFVFPKLGLHG